MPTKLTAAAVIKKLKAKANPTQLAGMARFGINPKGRLGASVKSIREIAKETGRDHQLALDLWKTGVAEARILAAIIMDPEKITAKQIDSWVKDLDSWDINDQMCMNFDKSPLAWNKLYDWVKSDKEFTKRAGYTMIACLAWHDKKAPDKKFIKTLPLIKQAATDERNMVKKAVNWALRNIGKRNLALNKVALQTAKEIVKIDDKTARWIAKDAIRELASEKIQARLRKK
ncbi:MAG: DNA alkylation repair protein [Parcubacteria group bacterium]|nr:DNA alkylation repair protein [Parcubacteria group bacterium]